MDAKTTIGMVQINNGFAEQCYFPYSVGMLQAYAQQHLEPALGYEFLPALFRRIPVAEAVTQLKDADIVCFSTYVWNIGLSLEIAQALKQIKPEILTVFGGPQIPDRDTECFLREHPCIDLACHGEGEQVFVSLLENYGPRNWEAVPSLSYIDATGRFTQTALCERIGDLTAVPSPYLKGVFSSLLESHPEVQWVGLWETNRGCPFSCAYCDWGSKTKNRVVARELEDVYQEADWFRDNQIEFIFCCDANFSLLERDLDIVKRVAHNKASHGYPKALSVQSTKNFTANSYAIYELMGQAGLSKGVSLSLQSVHAPTLAAIERKNISADVFRQAQQTLSALGIETFTDIILPLPEETLDSFIDGISTTIENGQHNRIQFNNLSILPNALMGDPAYQERYGLEIVETDMINIHGALADDNPVMEKQQLVVGTHAMPKPDWLKARVWGWMTALLHFDKLLQLPFVLLNRLYGIPCRDLLALFMRDDLPPVFARIQATFLAQAQAIQQGGVEFCESKKWLKIWWPADELALIELCSAGQLGAFYQEAEELLRGYLATKNMSSAESVLHDAVLLNRSLMKLPLQQEDLELKLSHNIWDVYHAALQGKLIPLEQGCFDYEIVRSMETWSSWEDWCRRVIWWGNKRGAYMYTCKALAAQMPIMEIKTYVNRQAKHISGRSLRHDRH
jgi:radical SAM superfamily enzyme YgiQ (UPF0313 family)